MSSWFEIVTTVLQAVDVETCTTEGAICPGTAFNAVAAAFATQGYFMQADMLYFLVGTGFGIWAPFVYMIAAAGGIISLAMGMPPRMYVWFFVGPGIYHWLVETRAPAHGVQWQVGGVNQDQRTVWKLAHVGLVNSSIAARMAGEVTDQHADSRYELQTDLKQASWCSKTNSPVYVSNFFLWFDQLISYTVQRLVNITGITRARDSSLSGSDQGVLDSPSSGSSNNWYLMSDKKWVLLDTITSARLSNSDLRDAFATFLSSECGDGLSKAIDHTNFVVASNSTFGQTPCTVMLHTNTDAIRTDTNPDCSASGTFTTDQYTMLWDVLRQRTTPIPDGIRNLFQDTSQGSFQYFLNGIGSDAGKKMSGYYHAQDVTECHQTFYTLMQGFRWETAQIFDQLKISAPFGIATDDVLFNLFYGWGVRSSVGGDLVSSDEMEDWVRNLIFVHLVRNELAIAPRIADKKFSNETALTTYSQNYVAQTGSKTKYGEVYSWARMVPYIQGILLYLLAMGYPFACIMIVMPGWHKTLFTWMSFWVWVKMWDAGFAVVTVVERSIWSMLGNSTKLNYISPMIYHMTDWGKGADTSCPVPSTSGTSTSACFFDLARNGCANVVSSFQADPDKGASWWHAAALFDRALLLGSTIDIDVANGYYIYLMSALYFAVPAATGQLILGAKAGVAGMANSLMQGGQQDGGRGASSGFTGALRNQAAAGAAATRASGELTAKRNSGFAAMAIGAGNAGLDAGLQQGVLGSRNSALSGRAQNIGSNAQVAGAMSQAGMSRIRMQEMAVENLGGTAFQTLSGINAFSGNPLDNYSKIQAAGTQASPGGAQTRAAPTGGSTGAATGGTAKRLTGETPWGLMTAKAQFGNDLAMSELTQAQANTSAGYQSQQQGNNIASFAASQAGSAAQMSAQRFGARADYAGAMGGYSASRNLSDNAAGYLSSIGIDSGVVSPGNKPTETYGAAGAGQLGSAARGMVSYSSQGFMGNVGRASAGLNANYGAGFVQSGYIGNQFTSQDWGLTGERAAGRAFNAMSQPGGADNLRRK